MKPKAIFTVKRRASPMLAMVVAYNEVSGRNGNVLASEPINNNFSPAELEAAAKRLVPQVSTHDCWR